MWDCRIDLRGDRRLVPAPGLSAAAPRWGIAYKFPTERKPTLLKNIVVQVGKSGKLTPVAELEPVFVDDIADMPQAVLDNARDGDVVLCMGAGSIGAVPGKLAGQP